MNADQNKPAENTHGENAPDQPLPVHNPFEKGDDKPVSQEDVDAEQKFKEAMSERD